MTSRWLDYIHQNRFISNKVGMWDMESLFGSLDIDVSSETRQYLMRLAYIMQMTFMQRKLTFEINATGIIIAYVTKKNVNA